MRHPKFKEKIKKSIEFFVIYLYIYYTIKIALL